MGKGRLNTSGRLPTEDPPFTLKDLKVSNLLDLLFIRNDADGLSFLPCYMQHDNFH